MSHSVPGQSSTSAPSVLDVRLRAAGQRIRMQLFLNHAARALCIGATVILLAVAADTSGLLKLPRSIIAGITLAIGISGAIFVALARPLSLLQVARIVEYRAGLQERLSSALAFADRATGPEASFYRAQRADAERHVAQLDLRYVLPLRIPATFWLGALSLLLLSLIEPLQKHPLFQSPRQKQEAAEVRQQGATLIRLADATEQQADRARLAQARRAAQETRRLGASMRRNRLLRKEALVRMRALTEQIARAHRRAAQQAADRSLERAGETFRRSLEQTQAEVRASRQRLPSPERDLQDVFAQIHRGMQVQDPQAMQLAMNRLADLTHAGALTGAQHQKAQKALQALAEALKDTGMQDAVRQLQALARQLQTLQGLSPETQSVLADQMRQIGQCMGRCPNPGTARSEAEVLQQLLRGITMSRMQLGMGSESPKQSHPAGPAPRQAGAGGTSAGPGRGRGTGSGSTRNAGQGPQEPGSRATSVARVPGKRSGNAPGLQITTSGAPGTARASIPYYQAYRTSRKAAEAIMDREAIPAAYREQVRAYFESIRP